MGTHKGHPYGAHESLPPTDSRLRGKDGRGDAPTHYPRPLIIDH